MTLYSAQRELLRDYALAYDELRKAAEHLACAAEAEAAQEYFEGDGRRVHLIGLLSRAVELRKVIAKGGAKSSEAQRLRRALERIATTPIWGPDNLQQIARDALKEASS